MVIHPGAEEAQFVLRAAVARRERPQVRVDLGLAEPGGEVERPVQAHGGGDLAEQLLHARHADRLEHRLAIGVGDGGVAAHRRQASSAT